MLNCEWAQRLSRYACREVTALSGEPCLEISTPFVVVGGAPVVLYIIDQGTHQLISDNGDTLTHLGAAGVEFGHYSRMRTVRSLLRKYDLNLSERGDIRCLARADTIAFSFAQCISGFVALGRWASEQLDEPVDDQDLAAEAEPYVIARDPSATFERKKTVMGASHTMYKFDMRHGSDLIDVIPPVAQATGGAMRKAGDVQNGVYSDMFTPLVIVDDREDADRAMQEIEILASITRSMSFTALVQSASRGIQ